MSLFRDVGKAWRAALKITSVFLNDRASFLSTSGISFAPTVLAQRVENLAEDGVVIKHVFDSFIFCVDFDSDFYLSLEDDFLGDESRLKILHNCFHCLSRCLFQHDGVSPRRINRLKRTEVVAGIYSHRCRYWLHSDCVTLS